MEIKELFKECLKLKSSDLHISPRMPPLFRINGELSVMPDMPSLDAQATKQLIYSVMDDSQQKLFEKTLDLDFAVIEPDIANFRVNVFQQIFGVAAAFRLIPSKVPTLEELGMPGVFKTLLEMPYGLILVTGPTGSGKSTTLAAMVNYINETEKCHIITVEDPIEYIHTSKQSLINQRQVHRDTTSFESALRSALREDPDVILVGEMRDLETIRLALTAAETGHLVMATLHTSSAPRTINRIVDVFPAGEKSMIRNMLSESLTGVISQTLVKNLEEGRTAALEIMVGTPAIRNLIREDKVAQMYTAIQTGKQIGMCTLEQYLQDLINKGLINEAEAEKVAIDKTLFKEKSMM